MLRSIRHERIEVNGFRPASTRHLQLLAPIAVLSIVLAASCAPARTVDDVASSPAATPAFGRAKLDIAYSFISDSSLHRPTSGQLLRGAFEGMRTLVATVGGDASAASPAFTDDVGTNLDDFRKFAAAAGVLAAANPELTANGLADAAIVGMIRADPDCHTYYVDEYGRNNDSRPVTRTGTGPQIPEGGITILGEPDQDGLQAKVLANGIAYVTWHAFEIVGTYKITDAVHAVLERSLAAGAKAWLFDLRGNIGGNGGDTMSSWFLDGQPTLRHTTRSGNPTTLSANRDVRLGPAYQLPIAIILNDRGGSAPEVFAASLKENKRATIVGRTSTGCLGGENDVPLGSDGSRLYVVQSELAGAVTGARFNNVGLTPDVPADDASAVGAAAAVLIAKLADSP
jgi:hypothetical protein